MSSFSLKGKVCIVTGSKQGLGKAISLTFAQAGADVALCSRTLEDGKLNAVSEEIRKMGQRSLVVQADVRSKTDVQNMVKTVTRELGTIDILVNNAGNYVESTNLELSEKDWDSVIDTHLKGTLLFCQTVGKEMVKRKGGNIINITSMNGSRPFINPGGYDVAKAGLNMLTKTLAIELADHNIRVNGLAPGYIATEGIDFLRKEPQRSAYYHCLLKNIAMHRFAQPAEIAKIALFLASEASSYMTGSIVLADGGFCCQWPCRYGSE